MKLGILIALLGLSLEVKGGLDSDDRCTFQAGDGIGGSEVKIGNQRGTACIDACIAKSETDPTINGVTVWSDTSKEGCWCEKGMKSRGANNKYKSCILLVGLNGDGRCTFKVGDGIGASEVKIGNQRGTACIDGCIARSETDPTINGVTVWSDTRQGGCWCEKGMKSRSANKKYKSCILFGLDGDDRCTFQVGDGIGGSEVKIGNQRGTACIDACIAGSETDPTINGVTVWTDTRKGGCWCEKVMKSRGGNNRYKSCILFGR